MIEFEQLGDAQQRAVLAHDRNYAVTAGAGSGKTTTLTARYLELLRETDADPESIAAITFTESGATELQERVRTAVSDQVVESNGETHRQWRRYHEALSKAYIHTIHGFCARLLREYALRADVPLGFDIIEATAARGHQADTVAAFVDDQVDDERLDAVTVVYGRRRLEELLRDLLANDHHRAREWADAWADRSPAEYIEFVRNEYATVDIPAARQCLEAGGICEAVADIERVAGEESAGRERLTIATNVAEAAETHEFDPDEMTDIEVHDAVAALCQALTSDGTAYRGSFDAWSYTGNGDWADESIERYETGVDTLTEAMPVESWATPDRLGVDRNAARAYTALASLYRDLHETYQARKRRESVLDFEDLIDRAVGLLSSNADIREQVRGSLDYVLLDEVQDTDPRQWTVVQLLVSDVTDYDDCNVFVVGDEKQSIFRFRGADVAQFRRERQRLSAANNSTELPPMETAQSTDGDSSLTRNFRSLPAVLGPVNDIFGQLFGQVPTAYRDVPTGVSEETRFEPSPQCLDAARTDPAGLSTGVTSVLVPDTQDARQALFDGRHTLDDAPEVESSLIAQTLATEIAALLADDLKRYETVSGVDGTSMAEQTAVEPADVAVLLRNRNNLQEYERALSERDIPYTVASGVGFYERTEIVALRTLFRVLVDPTEDLALFGVLRSPLFGFDDPTVVGCWDSIDREDIGDGALWRALVRTDDDGLAAARAAIERWRALAGIGDTDTVVETWDALLGRIVNETGYITSLAVDERGQQAVANLGKFRDQLREWSEEGIQTLSAVVDRIEREVEFSAREGDAAVPEDADGVRIMTVHDAKGLEFPVVLVPGLSQSFTVRSRYGNGAGEFETTRGEQSPLLGIRGPSVGDAFEQTDTVLKRRLTFARKREVIAEEKRILYVAMTRARDHLFLLGVTSADEDEPLSVEQDDADDPSSWFDLVGPYLFDEETKATFASEGEVTVCGPSETPMTVRAPRSTTAQTSPEQSPPPDLSSDVPDWEPSTRYSIPASYLGSLLEEGAPGDIYTDYTGRYIAYTPPDDPVEETSIGTETPDEGRDTGAGTTGGPTVSSLPRNVFGDALHKATELDISPDDTATLRALVEQFAVEHDISPGRVSADDIAELCRHRRVTQRYLSGFDGATADERPVRAVLDGGEVYGDIDSLSVTDDSYHIVDYKTNRIDGPEAINKKTPGYEWQLRAYAVALHQGDSTRAVRATLLFTDVDETWELEWSAGELDTEAERLDSAIQRALSTETN